MAFDPLDLGIKLLLVVLPLIISFFILSDSFRRRFNYILDLRRNAPILFWTMKELEGKMKALPNNMGEEAKTWKNRVQDLKIEVDKLRKEYEEWEKKSSFRRIWLTCGIAVRADLLQEKLKFLKEENVQADNLQPLPAVQKRDDVDTVPGLEPLLYEALLCLKDNGLNVIGIYGMGGIGKTTLLTLINNFLEWKHHPVSGNDAENQAPEEYNFHHVVWATASKEIDLKDLQEQLALGMGISLSPASSVWQRAEVIRRYMKDTSFLLLLDNLWEHLNLTELGIPNIDEATTQFKRKLIFTTRFQEVCNSMQTKKRLKVQFLCYNRALRLFTRTFNQSHDDIISIAKDIVKECGGLPLALTAIRDSISSGNGLLYWEDARNMLMKSNSIPGMDKVLHSLQPSYDSLKDDKMKMCFLCCVLWPKGVSIDQNELIRYWMGLKLLNEDRVDDSYVKGREYLRQLKGVGLLEAGDNEDHEVKMHNMIRVMALKIASNEYNWMVRAGFELDGAPADEEQWQEMDVVSLMFNNIITLPDFNGFDVAGLIRFPRLSTLMLQRNPLNQIPYGFFPRMPNLICLDLSHNNLQGLPQNINRLEGLRYMNLSNAGIESLPRRFGQLKNLRCLILNDAHNLQLLTPTVIPTKLQELDLYGSSGALENMEENIFGVLRHLQVLKITVRSEQMLRNLSELSGVKLWRIGIEGTDSFKHLHLNQILEARHMQEHLQELTISSLSNLEVPNLWRVDILPKLRSLSIIGCRNLSNISWVLKLRRLEHLRVCSCHRLTTLIEATGPVFRHLKHVYLEDLPNLQDINRGAEAFPYFRSAQVIIHRPAAD